MGLICPPWVWLFAELIFNQAGPDQGAYCNRTEGKGLEFLLLSSSDVLSKADFPLYLRKTSLRLDSRSWCLIVDWTTSGLSRSRTEWSSDLEIHRMCRQRCTQRCWNRTILMENEWCSELRHLGISNSRIGWRADEECSSTEDRWRERKERQDMFQSGKNKIRFNQRETK